MLDKDAVFRKVLGDNEVCAIASKCGRDRTRERSECVPGVGFDFQALPRADFRPVGRLVTRSDRQRVRGGGGAVADKLRPAGAVPVASGVTPRGVALPGWTHCRGRGRCPRRCRSASEGKLGSVGSHTQGRGGLRLASGDQEQDEAQETEKKAHGCPQPRRPMPRGDAVRLLGPLGFPIEGEGEDAADDQVDDTRHGGCIGPMPRTLEPACSDGRSGSLATDSSPSSSAEASADRWCWASRLRLRGSSALRPDGLGPTIR